MESFDLEGRRFRAVSNTSNGEVGGETVFTYHQLGDLVTADYAGGVVAEGHLLGVMLPDGRLDLRYHHRNTAGELMAGRCVSTPEFLPDGRLRFHEQWQWLTGDCSSGSSVIEEIC